MFTVFIEKESPEDGPPIGSSIPEEMQVDAEDETTIELAPGAVIDLNEGEKANATSPGRPNANFSGFVEAICRQIGAALEIPYELLLKTFTASYSASRGALEEAWKMFKMYRTWLATDFCQVIYEEWLAEAVAKCVRRGSSHGLRRRSGRSPGPRSRNRRTSGTPERR